MFDYGTFDHLTFDQAPSVEEDEAPPEVNSPVEVWVEKSRQGETWTAKIKQDEAWLVSSSQSELWSADADRPHVFDPAVFDRVPVFDTYKAGIWSRTSSQSETWTAA